MDSIGIFHSSALLNRRFGDRSGRLGRGDGYRVAQFCAIHISSGAKFRPRASDSKYTVHNALAEVYLTKVQHYTYVRFGLA